MIAVISCGNNFMHLLMLPMETCTAWYKLLTTENIHTHTHTHIYISQKDNQTYNTIYQTQSIAISIIHRQNRLLFLFYIFGSSCGGQIVKLS